MKFPPKVSLLPSPGGLPGHTVSRRDDDGWLTVEKETSTAVPPPVCPQQGDLPGNLQLRRDLTSNYPGGVPPVLNNSLLHLRLCPVPASLQPSEGFPPLAALTNTPPPPEKLRAMAFYQNPYLIFKKLNLSRHFDVHLLKTLFVAGSTGTWQHSYWMWVTMVTRNQTTLTGQLQV